MDGLSGLSEEVTRKNEEEPVKNNKQTQILGQQTPQRQKQAWPVGEAARKPQWLKIVSKGLGGTTWLKM